MWSAIKIYGSAWARAGAWAQHGNMGSVYEYFINNCPQTREKADKTSSLLPNIPKLKSSIWKSALLYYSDFILWERVIISASRTVYQFILILNVTKTAIVFVAREDVLNGFLSLTEHLLVHEVRHIPGVEYHVLFIITMTPCDHPYCETLVQLHPLF